MKCQKCGNTASYHYTQSINGHTEEYHLCSVCAAKEGLTQNLSFDFGGFFTEFLGNNFISSPKEAVCPTCSNTLSRFQKTGRMGCGDCYTTFYDSILPAISRIHGSTSHTGKLPKEAAGEMKTKRKIAELRQGLADAIKKEDFEKAATLRDKIREMEEEL